MAPPAPGAEPARPVAVPVPARLRRARAATGAIFAVHGAVQGSFAARVPWVAAHVGVGVGGLGVALLMPGIGGIAHLSSLTLSFALVVLLTAAMTAGAGALRPAPAGV